MRPKINYSSQVVVVIIIIHWSDKINNYYLWYEKIS